MEENEYDRENFIRIGQSLDTPGEIVKEQLKRVPKNLGRETTVVLFLLKMPILKNIIICQLVMFLNILIEIR